MMATNDIFKIELSEKHGKEEQQSITNVVIENVISITGFQSSFDEYGEVKLESPMYQGHDLIVFFDLEIEKLFQSTASAGDLKENTAESHGESGKNSSLDLDVYNLTVNLRPKRNNSSSDLVVAQVEVVVDEKIMLCCLEIEESCRGLAVNYPISLENNTALELISVIDANYREFFQRTILNAYRNCSGFFEKLRTDYPKDYIQAARRNGGRSLSELMGKEGYL